MRLITIAATCLLATGASANILECKADGLLNSATVNMNFQTWSAGDQSGDLTQVGDHKYYWSIGGDVDYTMTLARNGKSAKLIARGYGSVATGSCKLLAAGRTR